MLCPSFSLRLHFGCVKEEQVPSLLVLRVCCLELVTSYSTGSGRFPLEPGSRVLRT